MGSAMGGPIDQRTILQVCKALSKEHNTEVRCDSDDHYQMLMRVDTFVENVRRTTWEILGYLWPDGSVHPEGWYIW